MKADIERYFKITKCKTNLSKYIVILSYLNLSKKIFSFDELMEVVEMIDELYKNQFFSH